MKSRKFLVRVKTGATGAPPKFDKASQITFILFCQISKAFKKENIFVGVFGGRNFRLTSEGEMRISFLRRMSLYDDIVKASNTKIVNFLLFTENENIDYYLIIQMSQSIINQLIGTS